MPTRCGAIDLVELCQVLILGAVNDLEDGEDVMAAAECAANMYDANLLDAEDEEWGTPARVFIYTHI